MRSFVNYPGAGLSGYLHTINRDTVLMGECLSCGVMKPLAREDLEKHRIGLETLDAIGARLRCSSCGARNAKLLTGYYMGDDANE